MVGSIFLMAASICIVMLGYVLIHSKVFLNTPAKQGNQAQYLENVFNDLNTPKATPPTKKSWANQKDIMGLMPLKLDLTHNGIVPKHSTKGKALNTDDEPDNVIINLQAVIELNKRSVHSYEVLARMETSNGNYKSAREIFAGFKKKTQFQILDQNVLKQTVDVLSCLKMQNGLIMHVNISSQTLEGCSAFTRFYEVLKNHTNVCDNLVIEISQQQFSSLTRIARLRLLSIPSLGFRLSLDNCTDFARLAVLLETNKIACVKTPIMKFFEMDNAANEKQVIDIMSKCKTRGIPFIVTHVDEGYQIQQLIKYDVAFAQGFLFSAPKRPVSGKAAS